MAESDSDSEVSSIVTKSKVIAGNVDIGMQLGSESESNVVVGKKSATSSSSSSSKSSRSKARRRSAKTTTTSATNELTVMTASGSTSTTSDATNCATTDSDGTAAVPVPPRVCQFNYTGYSEERDGDGPVRRKATCKSCQAVIKESGSTTTNFIRHLRMLHPLK